MVHFEPIMWTGTSIRIIDQTRLPNALVYEELTNRDEVVEAIRLLKVRGAPLIGYTAAYGLCLAMLAFPDTGNPLAFMAEIDRQSEKLAAVRPTAVNLRWALDRVRKAARSVIERNSASGAVQAMLNEIHEILAEDRKIFRKIGELGFEVLKGFNNVLTHCHTGALTTAAYGTALAAFHVGLEQGKNFSVYVDETRPLLQGARITTFELKQAGIRAVLICDSAAAFLMSQGKVDAVIVGADRIAFNGDTANKIGTYSLAVNAGAHAIPFYVAAPWSTFDPDTAAGTEIPIEERDPAEITSILGTPIAPEDIEAYNPAFDVTPHQLITGIITEKGMLSPPYETAIKRIIEQTCKSTGKNQGDEHETCPG